MGKKGVRSVSISLDFKGKTAAELKKEVDKAMEKNFKLRVKEMEDFYGKGNLPAEFYQTMENEKQRLKMEFYEKIDMEFYMDKLSASISCKERGNGKY